jgi:hypothetical protein
MSLLRKARRHLLQVRSHLRSGGYRIPAYEKPARSASRNAYCLTCGTEAKVPRGTLSVLPEGSRSGANRDLCARRRAVRLSTCRLPLAPPLREMAAVPEESSIRHVAAESLRRELCARPIVNERIMRYLNEKNQLRLSEHIMAGVTRRVLEQALVAAPNGEHLTVEEFYKAVLNLLCEQCDGSFFVQAVCDWITSYRDNLLSLSDAPHREPWWEEMRRQWKHEKAR